jgi:DNA sulfur modification protein DndD
VQLRQLTVENLGPFAGTHRLDLAVSAQAPVVLVHGENMRGKTSLFNAIKWCLYGEIRGRHNRPIGPLALLSYDARDEGDYHFAATLEFEHEGAEYWLERRAQANDRPLAGADFQQVVTLRRNGLVQHPGDVQRMVAEILHPQISRFFLFDGEMLNQYEVLLGDPSRESDTVRSSIEQILGLPSLQLMAEDLTHLRRDSERRQLRAIQVERQNAGLIASAQQIADEVEALNRDIEHLETVHETAERERVALAERLERYGEIQADLRELERLESEVLSLQDDQAEHREGVRRIIQDAWWLPLTPSLKVRLEGIVAQQDAAAAQMQAVEGLRATVGSLEQSLAQEACALCGHQLESAARTRMTEALQESHQQLQSQSTELGDLGSHIAARKAIEPFTAESPLLTLRDAERSYRRAGIELRRARREADEVRERLRGHDRQEISATETQYEQCVRQIASIDQLLDDNRKKGQQLEREAARLQQEIARLPGADRKLSVEVAQYGALERLFLAAIDAFRGRLRDEVEEQASEIFQRLTTEPDYAGLRINERYGLTIVDSQNRPISERSAGAEQIVALSLIGGLNRSAVREAPVIMDTPFGRLDIGHRENILRFVPSLGRQVVLFVQSGELDRRRDLAHLEGSLAAEYRLARDGSPTRSRIERVGED